MQTYSCNSTIPQPSTPVGLSYQDMCKTEGIYRKMSSTTTSRLIVLRNNGDTTVLFKTDNNLMPADDGWKHDKYRYIKTDEKLIVDIK